MKRFAILSVIPAMIAGTVASGPMEVRLTASILFDQLPTLEIAADFLGACGGGEDSNPHIGYCATANTIFVSQDFEHRPTAAYEMAHVLGHAIQVRHGVADIALREIRNRRDEEDALRGMVTRQVECVAGVLMARAGEPRFDLRALEAEPFSDAHWGRSPINDGPRVTIGTAARAEWFDIGYDSEDFARCTVGEMSADLIVQAER